MPSCAPVRPARSAARLARPGARLSGNYGMRVERAARDVLPGHPVARHIDDFLTYLANANKPRNTIRAYRGDLIAFAACHDGEAPGARRRRLCRAGAPLGVPVVLTKDPTDMHLSCFDVETSIAR